MDPRHDSEWIGGVDEARTLTDPPVRAGTKVQWVARFLGRRMEYVTKVVQHDPPALMVMESESGPFPMTIRYQFEETEGGTSVQVRVQGDSKGFYRLVGPLLDVAVRRRLGADLRNLKELLESEAHAP